MVPYKDLRGFLEELKKEKELLQVDGVDWDIEMGTIVELMAEKNGPALLFDKIKDCRPGYRLTTNLLLTRKRLAMALGMSPDTSKLDLVRTFKSTEGTLIKPVEVKTGPVMENVRLGKDVNLFDFPAPKYHERDGGRYIGTGHVVIMKDPDEGWVNVGIERMMLQDENTMSLYISPGKNNREIRGKHYHREEPCPVVLAFGPEPILHMCGALSVPWGTSEYDVAGKIRGEPIEVIKGEITGIPFPAYDEIVMEGECILPSVEVRPEGPFGEWTGYYAGGVRNEPVIRVKAIYHRNDPIMYASPPMKPPLWAYSGFAVPVTCAPAAWENLEAAGVRGVKGVWMLEGGSERFIVCAAISQDHAGHAKQVGHALASCAGTGYISKIVIVVDDDIDPTNTDQVLWAVATRCDAATQVDMIRDHWGSALDPRLTPGQREQGDYTHTSMVIDACRPFHWRDKFPPTIEASPELKKKTIEKWGKKLGL